MFIKLNQSKGELQKIKEQVIEASKKNKVVNYFGSIEERGEEAAFILLENKKELFSMKSEKLQKLFTYRKKYIGILDVDKGEVNVVTSIRLHGHTGYSLLDGMIRINELAEKTEYSCAITDHGVLYGSIEFFKKMKEQNKKPIIGFEAYCQSLNGDANKNHLILLAKNQTGYLNIVKLCSLGQKNYAGRGQKRPQITHEQLEQYAEGIICLSACVGGEIPRAILEEDMELAKKLIIRFKKIFGEDFYLEIQKHYIENIKNGISEDLLNRKLMLLGKEFNVKVVATDDAHYLNKEDAEIHEAHLCNQVKTTINNPTRWRFPGRDYHVHTVEEMEEKFQDTPEVLIHTLEIMDKCNFEFEFGNYRLPSFHVPKGFTNEEYFEKLVWEGFYDRFKENSMERDSIEYRERLEFEIGVICKMGYANYFLIVWDFVKYAKDHGIAVGPGRGSACGSLVSYCLRITEMNPIPYGLLFERFLNPERVSMPDIDVGATRW